MPELHADLSSRHASPVEVYGFVAVDERGEDVMSDEICHRCNGKQRRRSRGRRKVQLPDWIMNNIKKQDIIRHQNEVTLVWGISERPESEQLVFVRYFVFAGLYLLWKEGGMKGVVNAESQVAASYQKIK